MREVAGPMRAKSLNIETPCDKTGLMRNLHGLRCSAADLPHYGNSASKTYVDGCFSRSDQGILRFLSAFLVLRCAVLQHSDEFALALREITPGLLI